VTEALKHISDGITAIFRHLLPGAIVMGCAFASRPSWFEGIDWTDAGHLTVMIIVTISIGNAWLVTHRYSLHQLFDLCWNWGTSRHPDGYLAWLSEFIPKSIGLRHTNPVLSNHLFLRSTQLIVLLIIGESLFVFTCLIPPENSSSGFTKYVNENRTAISAIGVLIFVIAVIQDLFVNSLDRMIVESQSKPQASPSRTDQEHKS